MLLVVVLRITRSVSVCTEMYIPTYLPTYLPNYTTTSIHYTRPEVTSPPLHRGDTLCTSLSIVCSSLGSYHT